VLEASTSPPKERYAVSNDNVFKLVQPGAFDDQLTEILRQGARRAFGDRRANPEVCAPSRAKAAAIARPMPRLPPVTTTTLLSNSPMAESHVSIIVLAASSAKNLDAVTKAIAEGSGSRFLEPVTVAADLLNSPNAKLSSPRCASAASAATNNAGATQAGNFLDLPDSAWIDGYALKLFGCVRNGRCARRRKAMS
jgi:hypothetical protein